MLGAECNQTAREVEQAALVGVQVPVEPADLIVLTVGVVVAVLAAAHFVAAKQHRHAL